MVQNVCVFVYLGILFTISHFPLKGIFFIYWYYNYEICNLCIISFLTTVNLLQNGNDISFSYLLYNSSTFLNLLFQSDEDIIERIGKLKNQKLFSLNINMLSISLC